MIVDCAYYQDGLRQGENAVALEEAAALHGRDGFVWLGLFEPDADELARMRAAFGLHELAIEDGQALHRRPKIESYDQDVHLIVVRTARYNDDADEAEFGEISCCSGG
jgi:magnesium transporter